MSSTPTFESAVDQLETFWDSIRSQPDEKWTIRYLYDPLTGTYCALGWVLHQRGYPDRVLQKIGTDAAAHLLGLEMFESVVRSITSLNDHAYDHEDALFLIRKYIDKLRTCAQEDHDENN